MANSTLLILNGPGLAGVHGNDQKLSLDDIQQACSSLCAQLQIDMEFRQVDAQDTLEHWITAQSKEFDALIINPANTSHATDGELSDAALESLSAFGKPICEVHISNIFQSNAEPEKPLRVPNADISLVCGLGLHSYLFAIRAIKNRLDKLSTSRAPDDGKRET